MNGDKKHSLKLTDALIITCTKEYNMHHRPTQTYVRSFQLATLLRNTVYTLYANITAKYMRYVRPPVSNALTLL